MKRRRAFVTFVLILVALSAPVIPAYRINGPSFHGTILENGPIVGFGPSGECVEQMLVSLFYLLTDSGPHIVLRAGALCA
jgi:hypothetical protein